MPVKQHLEILAQDLRYAALGFLRAPGFALVRGHSGPISWTHRLTANRRRVPWTISLFAGRRLQRSTAAAPVVPCRPARGSAAGIIFEVTLTHPPPHQSVIRAAGGILQRTTPDGEEVMLVYRKRYGDWSLPKGKLNTGESFPEAALREVEEETGCVARLGEYAGEVTYAIGGAVKLVRFWRMSLVGQHPIEEQEEVAEARWFRIPDAIQKLTYSLERDLLARLWPVDAGRQP